MQGLSFFVAETYAPVKAEIVAHHADRLESRIHVPLDCDRSQCGPQAAVLNQESRWDVKGEPPFAEQHTPQAEFRGIDPAFYGTQDIFR
jgi:hypothetical protein